MKKVALLFLAAAAAVSTRAQVVSDDGLMTYYEGDCNLILTVPHGGLVKPDGWPDRRHGCRNSAGKCYYDYTDESCEPNEEKCRCVFLPDKNTQEVAVEVADTVFDLTGKRPHIVMNNVRRSKMDANRDEEQAAQGWGPAEDAWDQFHSKCREVVQAVEGRGLLLDIHGNGHMTNTTEMGYLLSRGMLYKELVNPAYFTKSYVLDNIPMYHLYADHEEDSDLRDIIYGDFGLGALLEEKGYKGLPSPSRPTIEMGEDYKYFQGGYDIRELGSFMLSNPDAPVDAIQVEAPSESRWRDGVEARKNYSRALGEVVVEFFNHWYGEL